jgi:hypothetical protein
MQQGGNGWPLDTFLLPNSVIDLNTTYPSNDDHICIPIPRIVPLMSVQFGEQLRATYRSTYNYLEGIERRDSTHDQHAESRSPRAGES